MFIIEVDKCRIEGGKDGRVDWIYGFVLFCHCSWLWICRGLWALWTMFRRKKNRNSEV